VNETLHLADTTERRGRGGGGRGGYGPLAVLMLVLGRLGLADPLAFYALPDGVQELQIAHTVNEISGAYREQKGQQRQSAAEANRVWTEAVARASGGDRGDAPAPWWTAIAAGGA